MSELISNAAKITFTENGALTYNTSSNAVLDLFSMGGALRTASVERIKELVTASANEDLMKTIQVLLYLRDIRGGQGEKRIFREGITIIRDILKEKYKDTSYDDTFEKMLNFLMDPTKITSYERAKREVYSSVFDAIVEVGSWKDIVEVFEPVEYAFYVKEHLNDKNSLMYKWLPSISGAKNKQAETLARCLGMSPKEYRKLLSLKRAELKLVETSMCERRWGDIEYSKVPSQANLKYRKAFERNDEERYKQFLKDVNNKEGGTKINTSTLLPYQIVNDYLKNVRITAWSVPGIKEEESLETLWKNLPEYRVGENALVIADTSGSMTVNNYLPISVALSLALYFAEHNTGKFKDEFITFSSNPSFFRVDRNESLAERIGEALKAEWGGSTNFIGTFERILDVAKNCNLPESEMPKTLYCISDMEFDTANGGWNGTGRSERLSSMAFKVIEERYAEAGYKMPRLVFWNVNSHQNNVPVSYNDMGVALVSGCSPSVFELVMSDDMDPISFMDKAINVPRYMEPARSITWEVDNLSNFFVSSLHATH